MSKTVILFTQPDCPPCRWAKSHMEDKGIDYVERDITEDPQAVDDLVNKYQSRSTPTLVIGEEVMIGFDPERLEELLAE
jgi:glutaredoxin-like YruB-family protein